MCRLFGLHAGPVPVPATFWLLDAPTSLEEQSRQNPDGAGIGVFGAGDPSGDPLVIKSPMAAWQDAEFATAAHDLRGTTFVAHVRYASTGGLTAENTHPFLQDDRLFAHNGVFTGLDVVDARIAELGGSGLVHGETDSERLFALITVETRAADGDLEAGIVTAVSWVAARVPLFSLNFVLVTATDMWGLRYPESHELWLLERSAGGHGEPTPLDAASPRIRARSDDLAGQPAVILATRRMDDDPAWRLLAPGELLRVGADLRCHWSTPFAAPAHLLTMADCPRAGSGSKTATIGGFDT
ncbi:MAG: class II glutamine amidotransferase [Nakamurella sp.]